MGGEMASVIREDGIQFDGLNESKGKAVRSTREPGRQAALPRRDADAARATQSGGDAPGRWSRRLHIDGGRERRAPRVVGVTTTVGVRYRASAVDPDDRHVLPRRESSFGEARAAGGARARPRREPVALARCAGFPLARLKTGHAVPDAIERRSSSRALELQHGENRRRDDLLVRGGRRGEAAAAQGRVWMHVHEREDPRDHTRRAAAIAIVPQGHKGTRAGIARSQRGQSRRFAEQGAPPDITRARGRGGRQGRCRGVYPNGISRPFAVRRPARVPAARYRGSRAPR